MVYFPPGGLPNNLPPQKMPEPKPPELPASSSANSTGDKKADPLILPNVFGGYMGSGGALGIVAANVVDAFTPSTNTPPPTFNPTNITFTAGGSTLGSGGITISDPNIPPLLPTVNADFIDTAIPGFQVSSSASVGFATIGSEGLTIGNNNFTADPTLTFNIGGNTPSLAAGPPYTVTVTAANPDPTIINNTALGPTITFNAGESDPSASTNPTNITFTAGGSTLGSGGITISDPNIPPLSPTVNADFIDTANSPNNFVLGTGGLTVGNNNVTSVGQPFTFTLSGNQAFPITPPKPPEKK